MKIKPPLYRISTAIQGATKMWSVDFIKPFGDTSTTSYNFGHYRTLKAAKAAVAHLRRPSIDFPEQRESKP